MENDHDDLEAWAVEVDEVRGREGVPPMFAFGDIDGNKLVVVEQA